MGNCGTRECGQIEEAGMYRSEKLLKLHSVSAKQLDNEIRKMAVHHVLTIPQFNLALKKVGVSYQQSKDRSRISEYWGQFGTIMGAPQASEKITMLVERDLCFLAIFLTEKDSSKTKAELLFEAIDTDAEEVIAVQQFNSAFEDIFKIMVQNIYTLASGDERKGFVNDNLLRSYLNNLEQGKALGLTTLEKLLFDRGEHVSKQEWMEVFLDQKQLLTCKGIRRFFYESFVSKRCGGVLSDRMSHSPSKASITEADSNPVS